MSDITPIHKPSNDVARSDPRIDLALTLSFLAFAVSLFAAAGLAGVALGVGLLFLFMLCRIIAKARW